jgi:hypothetical protein
MADKEDDVAVGAAKYGERAPLGTSAPGAPEKDYHEPQSTPFFEPREFRLWSFWRAGIAEFMASLLFLYITIQTVMGHDRPADPCLGVGIQGIAWAFGGMIFTLVYCTAGISGGHINPAVTFGLFLARKVSLPRAVFYMICQCLGAICGAGIVKAFQPGFYQTNGGGLTPLPMATPRAMAWVLRLWAPLCWCTLSSLPLMPSEMPVTPMCQCLLHFPLGSPCFWYTWQPSPLQEPESTQPEVWVLRSSTTPTTTLGMTTGSSGWVQ